MLEYIQKVAKNGLRMCVFVRACELVVQVDDQRVVPPVKGGEQIKETEEAHLRRTVEDRETHFT